MVKLNGKIWESFNSENSGLPYEGTVCLAVDLQDNLWIGSQSGLIRYDGKDWKIFTGYGRLLTDPNYIEAIAVDNDYNIWVATYGGLAEYNGIKWKVYNPDNSPLPSYGIYNIEIDGNNKWIGTEEGLVKFYNNYWEIFDTSNSGLPLYNRISCSASDIYGNIWLATRQPSYVSRIMEGGGLTKFDGMNWTIYNRENSLLPSNDISALLVDNNSKIWIGTMPYYIANNELNTGGGLVCFDGISWQVFNAENSPLPSNAVNHLEIDSKKNIWISTISQWIGNGKYTQGGIAVYNPDGVILSNKNNETTNPGSHYLPRIIPIRLILQQQFLTI